jgi:hypothetical protein
LGDLPLGLEIGRSSPPIDQDFRVQERLQMFGNVYCYVSPEAIEDETQLQRLAAFCRRMGRDTQQGEIGLVIADEYFAIRDFDEEPTP